MSHCYHRHCCHSRHHHYFVDKLILLVVIIVIIVVCMNLMKWKLLVGFIGIKFEVNLTVGLALLGFSQVRIGISVRVRV